MPIGILRMKLLAILSRPALVGLFSSAWLLVATASVFFFRYSTSYYCI